MTAAEKTRMRGKPKGTRSQPDLYGKILEELTKDKADGGDGMTAYAISKQLAVPDPTIRMYAEDLVKEKKLTAKIIRNMTVYRLKKDQEKQ